MTSDCITKRISPLVTADGKTASENNCFQIVGLVGLAKFGDLVKSEEPQLSETLLAVKEILTWDLTFATFFWCLEYVIWFFNVPMAISPNLRDDAQSYSSLKNNRLTWINENHPNKYTVQQYCMQKQISRTIHSGYYQRQFCQV